jgi:hypothetical protein
MGLGVAGLVLGNFFLYFLPFLHEWHMDFNRGHDNRLKTLAGFLLEQNQLPCLLV